MSSFCHGKPWFCRFATVSIGVAIFAAGVRLGDFWGLVLMIIGLVPTVTGVADVSMLAEIRDDRAHRRDQRRGAPVPTARRA